MLNDADVNAFSKICLVTGYTDLRRGIDGLSAMIQSSYELDPCETNVLFLFCGRRLDRIKGDCFGKETDSFFYTSVWKKENFNGREMSRKFSA